MEEASRNIDTMELPELLKHILKMRKVFNKNPSNLMKIR